MKVNDCVDLHVYAEKIGVRLAKHDNGPKGFYVDGTRTVSTRRGLSIQAYRSTLAHELAHATYRDKPTGNGHYDRRQEARADQWAAQALIDPKAFEDAYIWHRGDPQGIADELEVTHHILDVWRAHHERKTPA